MPKSDRSIANELQSLNQTLGNYDQVIAENQANKQKAIDEFVANKRLWPDGQEISLTTPGEEPNEVSLLGAIYDGSDISYSFSDGSVYTQMTLEGEGYDWD